MIDYSKIDRRRFLRISVFAGVGIGLAACVAPQASAPAAPAAPTAPKDAPKETAAPATESPKPAEAPAPAATEGPVLRLNMPAFYGDPGVGTDPGCSGGANTIFTNYFMFSPLAYLDEKNVPQPEAAESWMVNDDATVWTFKLRENLKWTDGTPITAEDFVWTIKRNMAPDISCGGAVTYMMDVIKGAGDYIGKKVPNADNVGVKALDAHTLEITMEAPTGYFAQMVQYPTYAALPRKAIEDFGKDTQWTLPEHVLGNGPFKLTEWVKDQKMVMQANPYWHGYEGKTPAVSRLEIQMIKQQPTGIAAYETGELDAMDVPSGDLGRVKGDATLSKELVSYAELLTQYMIIPVGMKPFDDIRVRKALAMAIDRETLANTVLQGVVKPAYQFLPPGMLGYDGQVGTELKFNPEEAKKLLADAGFPDGKGFPKFYINSNHTDDYQTMFEAIQAMYKEHLNIDMELALMDPGARAKWLEEDPERRFLWRERWGMDFPDSHNSMNFMSSKTQREKNPVLVYKNDKFAQLVADGAKATDPKVRQDLYRQADHELIVENPYIIVLYYGGANVLVKPYVKGAFANALGMNWRNAHIEK